MTDNDRAAWNHRLGAVIVVLRERASLSRVELAERAGIPADELEEIEAGRLQATWGDLRRLAYALGVSLPDLLREVEAMKP